MDSKTMLIGVNTHFNRVEKNDPAFDLTAHGGKGVDFMVLHTDPNNLSLDDACTQAKKIGEIMDENGIDYVANFEFQNFSAESKSPDGTDWANFPDGTHRPKIPQEYMKALRTGKGFMGIMYDEYEHSIINRNLSITLASKGKKILPVFPLSESSDPVEQGELLDSQVREYSEEIRSGANGIMVGEHVFPVLFHTFARNGVIPNFKSQKESVSNIQFACAAGAALEYGTPLWNCVDMWFRLTNPGHTADEMFNNLKFAYYAGVNRVYVESAHVFTENGNLNENGKKFTEFSEKFRGKERSYDVHDYRPEIAIIRYDDSYWGQGDPVAWRKMLFGNKKIKPDYRSKEYLKIFSILTHGETSPGSFSWDKVSPWSLRKHFSFASLNSTAVFDDRVKKETLEGVKLCFLSGIQISRETLEAVEQLVKESGLTVVCPKRFAPKDVLARVNGRFSEIADGKGIWIVTDNFCSSKLKKRIAPFIGRKGEIRLTFRNDEIRLKISKNGEAIEEIE